MTTRVTTREELEAAIENLEVALLKLEDMYEQAQCDAEVIGDDSGIKALDKEYGETEKTLAQYRSNLDDIISGRLVAPKDIEDIDKLVKNLFN